MIKVDSITGSEMMRLWGVESWSDPGADYYLWGGCCVFALVRHCGFSDVHIAMSKKRWRDCREAGAEFLRMFGMGKLRAVILQDRPKICNYARRMGFGEVTTEKLKTVNGSESSFFIMWREPGEYHGRCN